MLRVFDTGMSIFTKCYEEVQHFLKSERKPKDNLRLYEFRKQYKKQKPKLLLNFLSVQQMHKNVFHRLVHLFRNVHALVKYRRPFTDYVWMFLHILQMQKGASQR